jgi:hypothetical protein
MRYSIFALFLLLGGSTAQGATIALRSYDGGPEGGRLFTIRVQDRLEPGDLGTIKQLFRQARHDGLSVVALELGSWGGDADSGMAIARYVHDKKGMKVMVNGVCSSACAYAALVALGDGRLLVRDTAVVGVHQVYDNGTHDPDRPWTRRAADTLRSWGAPASPLEDMVKTLPSGMVWYYVDDLAEMGASKLDQGSDWWPW